MLYNSHIYNAIRSRYATYARPGRFPRDLRAVLRAFVDSDLRAVSCLGQRHPRQRRRAPTTPLRPERDEYDGIEYGALPVNSDVFVIVLCDNAIPPLGPADDQPR